MIMQVQNRISTLFVAIFLLVFGLAVYGQDRERIEVNIPVRFIVEKTTLPPGRYLIQQADENDVTAWTIRSHDGRLSVDFLTVPVETRQAHAKPYLALNEVGDRYFLSEFFTSGGNYGREITKSTAELQLERIAEKQATRTVQAGSH
jgi:hypothetical protein